MGYKDYMKPPEGYPHTPEKPRNDYSRFKFVSFVLPLMAIPLVIKGAQLAAKEIKKAIDKKKIGA